MLQNSLKAHSKVTDIVSLKSTHKKKSIACAKNVKNEDKNCLNFAAFDMMASSTAVSSKALMPVPQTPPLREKTNVLKIASVF
jgi:hypothetical protein